MSTPVGPYTPIVRAGDFLVVSGQLGLRDGQMVAGGVAEETAQAIANMSELLAGEGASLSDVVKRSKRGLGRPSAGKVLTCLVSSSSSSSL
jgi:2-iminobutanoate/2-iminopropanoate deaminase